MTNTTMVIDGNNASKYDEARLNTYLDSVLINFPDLNAERYKERIFKSISSRKEIKVENISEMIIENAHDEITDLTPDWTFVASQFYIKQLEKDVARRRGVPAYSNYKELVEYLVSEGLYHEALLRKYSAKELREAGEEITPENDELFTYLGVLTLAKRYVVRNHDNEPLELPQERWMTIALHLMQDEDKSHRMELVKEAYWALSNLYMTVATPTLSNAGKTHGQLSSCFIDIVEDDLRNIYDSNTDVATLSKGGGGIGVYLGKIRSKGSDIKGFKGVASGIIGWAKQLNNTAVSVDQLGNRQGSIAIYYDVWGKDISTFLDLKLNNGDERQRTHDLFTGVTLPDIFMEAVEARSDWYLFDAHEIRTKKGWSLEDYYDEEEGRGTFRDKYQELVEDPNISKDVIPAIDIMKRIMVSQLETGSPFMFYRDTVNRDNPNKHKGMIYCSNLCTEIMQNLSPTEIIEETINGDEIIIRKNSGDFVTCNLSSINLARAVPDGVLERLIPIQVRMLDNVIDLNTIEVKQAQITNQRYRAIGLGTMGVHHLLALEGIRWETDEAVEYNDNLYEEINFLTIKASVNLSKEKGAYKYFEGSDWENGKHFERRGYTSGVWVSLQEDIRKHGLRNGYLMAVAPNGSTSIIAGTTPSVDPIFRLSYTEEKKDYRGTIVAPDLNMETRWYYKSAYAIEQLWSLKQNSARQRHVDQGISFNFYVDNRIKASELLQLHMSAWELKLKSTYYVRSTAVDLIDCESCSA